MRALPLEPSGGGQASFSRGLAAQVGHEILVPHSHGFAAIERSAPPFSHRPKLVSDARTDAANSRKKEPHSAQYDIVERTPPETPLPAL